MAEDVWDIIWKWGDYPNEFEVAENWWEALKAGISFLSTDEIHRTNRGFGSVWSVKI